MLVLKVLTKIFSAAALNYLYYKNKQYVKINLMQNEANLSSIFLVKVKYW